jgi:hypothetical protein
LARVNGRVDTGVAAAICLMPASIDVDILGRATCDVWTKHLL